MFNLHYRFQYENQEKFFRLGYKTSRHLVSNSSISGAESTCSGSKNVQTTLLREVWLSGLDSLLFEKQSILMQTIRHLRGKTQSSTIIKNPTRKIIRGEREILSRCREYIKDLLNPLIPAILLIYEKRKSFHWQKWQQLHKD